MLIHDADCNHSCTHAANHSYLTICNYRYPMEISLAERIATIRKAAGDSPAKAAEKIGVSRQGYMKWENGNTANMKLGNLITFCDKYKVNIEHLLRGMSESIDQRPADNLENFQYSNIRSVPALRVSEPDPDERTLIEGFRSADNGMKRALLALAREAQLAFEKRSEAKD